MSLNTILATAPLTATGYHLKATGTTLGQSLIWDNGTNVGIGNTNTSYTLDVSGTGRFTAALTSAALLSSGTSGAGGQEALRINNDNGYIGFFNTSNTTRSGYLQGNTTDVTLTTSLSTPLIFGTANVEKMRITSGGNVGIGTTAPNSSGYGNLVLTIGNGSTSIDNAIEIFGNKNVDGGIGDIAFLNGADTGADKRMAVIRCNRDSNNTSGAILFYTKNTGSFQLSNRITSTGKIISACTENSFTYDITNSNATSPSGVQIGLSGGVFNNTTQRFIECYTSNGDKFRVYTNGNVVNSNNSYGPLSDIKLKENITDTSAKLDKLMQVRIVNYNLINDPELKQIGVIAQELEQVFPGLIDEHQDTDREGNDLGTTTKSVKMSVFVPILIKAMQEQNQTIQELSNRLIKLESK